MTYGVSSPILVSHCAASGGITPNPALGVRTPEFFRPRGWNTSLCRIFSKVSPAIASSAYPKMWNAVLEYTGVYCDGNTGCRVSNPWRYSVHMSKSYLKTSDWNILNYLRDCTAAEWALHHTLHYLQDPVLEGHIEPRVTESWKGLPGHLRSSLDTFGCTRSCLTTYSLPQFQTSGLRVFQ